MKQAKKPQPEGEVRVGCLVVSCCRPSIFGPRGGRKGYRTSEFDITITNHAIDFCLLCETVHDENLTGDDPLSHVSESHPKDTLSYQVSYMVGRYCDVFTHFPQESFIRHAIQSAYKKMRAMESADS